MTPRWLQRLINLSWVKRLDDPRTHLGHWIVTGLVAVFAVIAFAQNPNRTKDCVTNPLHGVYNPKRLRVVKTCVVITGTVKHSSYERDGDDHIQLDVADKSLLSHRNYTNQSGYLVVEYMPADHYPAPTVGEQLRLTCTYVYDLQHGGWAECHPVFSVQPLGQTANKIVP